MKKVYCTATQVRAYGAALAAHAPAQQGTWTAGTHPPTDPTPPTPGEYGCGWGFSFDVSVDGDEGGPFFRARRTLVQAAVVNPALTAPQQDMLKTFLAEPEPELIGD